MSVYYLLPASHTIFSGSHFVALSKFLVDILRVVNLSKRKV